MVPTILRLASSGSTTRDLLFDVSVVCSWHTVSSDSPPSSFFHGSLSAAAYPPQGVRLQDDCISTPQRRQKHLTDVAHATEQPPANFAEHSNAETQGFDSSTDSMGFRHISTSISRLNPILTFRGLCCSSAHSIYVSLLNTLFSS